MLVRRYLSEKWAACRPASNEIYKQRQLVPIQLGFRRNIPCVLLFVFYIFDTASPISIRHTISKAKHARKA